MNSNKKKKVEELINCVFNESCLDTLEGMPDGCVDSVITSPPYWNLRRYLGVPDSIWDDKEDCQHEFTVTKSKINNDESEEADIEAKYAFCKHCGAWKGQLGLEPTIQLFISHLMQIMDEIYRVLKPEGTCFVNLGDTYMNNSSYTERGRQGFGRDKIGMMNKVNGEVPLKSLCLIPHRFAIACADRKWIIRNDCVWAKKNCLPESVTDRFAKKHEYFFFMTKSQKYFFDLDAIRDKHKQSSYSRINQNSGNPKFNGVKDRDYIGGDQTLNPKQFLNEKGKNPGDVSDFWDVPTKPSRNEHYASYNDELLLKPVLAGCPEGGIIYDPFFGTGSTGEVALRSNRNFIGSEMSPEYVKICNARLEPFLIQQKLF